MNSAAETLTRLRELYLSVLRDLDQRQRVTEVLALSAPKPRKSRIGAVVANSRAATFRSNQKIGSIR
jgi:hypothetical protein